jgi:lipoprotein signal peptidase
MCGFAITLILAGAFGNGIDRCFYGVFYGTTPLFYGGVVDFILVDIPDIDFL